MNSENTDQHPIYTNDLIYESSPYLKQHANNPVNWKTWNKKTLNEAIEQDKLLIISVGYATCHWCHVMEKESFENEEVAAIMNKHFVCIKVDREERPDLDNIYMDVVQKMTGQGGWPMNVIALPDGRPIYGGTYFRKAEWTSMLRQIAGIYQDDKTKCLDYAQKITASIQPIIQAPSDEIKINKAIIQEKWLDSSDKKWGGNQGAPKFPMPNLQLYFLNEAYRTEDENLINQININLQRMEQGGIYDHIEGGFSRYAVDEYWHVPHFEKMLYDNAQLLSLYAKAFQYNSNKRHLKTINGIIDWLNNEMLAENGAFYSAMDADSEGVEGKYFVWSLSEIKTLLPEDWEIYKAYYQIKANGNWEGTNVLFEEDNKTEICKGFGITNDQLEERINHCNEKLFKERSKREKPITDDKHLCAWNALLLKGLIDAQYILKNEDLDASISALIKFINEEFITEDGQIKRTINQKGESINGFLDDYAFTIDALIATYEYTADIELLDKAKSLTSYVIDHFSSKDQSLFFYNEDNNLITRPIELEDNVIPSSNSQMAINLFKLGNIYGEEEWIQQAKKMLSQVSNKLEQYPNYHSNWLKLIDLLENNYQLVICSKNAQAISRRIKAEYPKPIIICPMIGVSDISIAKNRWIEDKEQLYLCKDQTCLLPADNIQDILDKLK
jgi:uncharacterized protein YyaL (SSP411 family)